MSFCGWFSGEHYRDHFEKGIYACSQCGHKLFGSQSKYEHSSPWPAFNKLIQEDSVSRREESPTAIKFQRRIHISHRQSSKKKISCGKCGNGLGHEFIGDGPKKGQNRY